MRHKRDFGLGLGFDGGTSAMYPFGGFRRTLVLEEEEGAEGSFRFREVVTFFVCGKDSVGKPCLYHQQPNTQTGSDYTALAIWTRRDESDMPVDKEFTEITADKYRLWKKRQGA